MVPEPLDIWMHLIGAPLGGLLVLPLEPPICTPLFQATLGIHIDSGSFVLHENCLVGIRARLDKPLLVNDLVADEGIHQVCHVAHHDLCII